MQLAAPRRLDGAGVLSTFSLELGAVTLVPGTGGIFEIAIDGELIWERKRDGGFPDVKTLKQMVRDRIDPDRDLGPHRPARTGRRAKRAWRAEQQSEDAFVHLRGRSAPWLAREGCGGSHPSPSRLVSRQNHLGRRRIMTKALVLAAALAGIALPSFAQDLPDLGGRTIKAVTENAYSPLNFEDPANPGKGIGLEYDVMNEVGQAPQRHGRVEPHGVGRDDRGGAHRPVRRRHGRHLDHRRARGGDRFHRALHQPRPVHAGARRRDPHHRTESRSRRSRAS